MFNLTFSFRVWESTIRESRKSWELIYHLDAQPLGKRGKCEKWYFEMTKLASKNISFPRPPFLIHKSSTHWRPWPLGPILIQTSTYVLCQSWRKYLKHTGDLLLFEAPLSLFYSLAGAFLFFFFFFSDTLILIEEMVEVALNVLSQETTS